MCRRRTDRRRVKLAIVAFPVLVIDEVERIVQIATLRQELTVWRVDRPVAALLDDGVTVMRESFLLTAGLL